MTVRKVHTNIYTEYTNGILQSIINSFSIPDAEALSLSWMNITCNDNRCFDHFDSIPVRPAIFLGGAVAGHEAPEVGFTDLPSDSPAVITSDAVVIVLEEEPAVAVLENWSSVQPPVSAGELPLEVRILLSSSVEEVHLECATQRRHGSSSDLQAWVRAPLVNGGQSGSEFPIVHWRFFTW